MIRFIIAACLIGFGVFIFGMSTFGIFKFKYVLNRMHAAAMGDTLGIMSVIAGVMVMTGFTFATLKLLIVIIFFCLTAPVASHMIAKMEIAAKDENDQKRYEERFDDGVEEN